MTEAILFFLACCAFGATAVLELGEHYSTALATATAGGILLGYLAMMLTSDD